MGAFTKAWMRQWHAHPQTSGVLSAVSTYTDPPEVCACACKKYTQTQTHIDTHTPCYRQSRTPQRFRSPVHCFPRAWQSRRETRCQSGNLGAILKIPESAPPSAPPMGLFKLKKKFPELNFSFYKSLPVPQKDKLSKFIFPTLFCSQGFFFNFRPPLNPHKCSTGILNMLLKTQQGRNPRYLSANFILNNY